MKQAIALLIFGIAAAVHGAPYIGYAYPCGAAAGSRVQVIIGGQGMFATQRAMFTGEGIEVLDVKLVPNFQNPAGSQRKYLVEWLNSIAAGKPNAPELPENTDDWRKKNAWWENLDKLDELSINIVTRDLYTPKNALQMTPSIRQLVILELAIAPDAKPGRRVFRLTGDRGTSPPLSFFVDAIPHLKEPLFVAPGKPLPPTPEALELPIVLDGQIMPGETDAFRISLAAGKDYTFELTGRALEPFIGDAVPGHFQPILRLLDEKKKEVAYADDNYFHPDPVLRFRPAKSGIYTLEIRDNLFRGREDFVYRVKAEQGAGKPYAMLPLPELPVINRVKKPGQVLATPFIASGIIARPGDAQIWRFTGRAGQELVLEVFARQLNSPLDAFMTLIGPDGKVLAQVDDNPVIPSVGPCIQYFDPYLRVKLPKSGEYKVVIRDLTGFGGKDYRYHLRVDQPRPDFQVYTSRSVVNLAPGATGKLKLQVRRLDGFREELKITSPDCEVTGTIPAGADSAEISIKNALKNRGAMPITLEASCELAGKTVKKQVIPAEEYIQAFAYYHLLPAEALYLSTLGGGGPRRK